MKMENHPSPEIRLFCDSLKRFMHKEVAPRVEAVDHYPVVPEPAGTFESLLAGLDELGLLSLLSSQESTDAEGAMELLAAAVETMAQTYASVPALILAHTLAQYLVSVQGTEEQKQHWLAPLASRGRMPLLAFPMYLEPDGTGLELEDFTDENRARTLLGSCDLVVNSPLADALLLPVRVDGGLGMILLPRDTDRLSLSEPVLTLGLRGCPVADVEADGVVVPDEAVLGGWGTTSLKEVYNVFAGPVAALCAGICAGSLHEAAAYVEERRQGGHLLREYSQVRMMLAGMARDCEIARTAAQSLSRPEGVKGEQAISLFVSAREGVTRAVQDGVQLLGGYGYMEDYGQERRMRDAKQAQILLGRDDLRRLDLGEACLTS